MYHRPAPCVLPRSSSSGASCWAVSSPARRPRARPRGRRRAPGGTSAGASARIGQPTWTRRVGIGTRSAIRRTRVSMWTLFPRSQATAGGTTSSRTSARRSSFRPAGCSIATRLEFSFAQRKNGLDQRFRSITDYDGLPMDARRGSTVVSNTQASIDHLTVRTLSLNAYYDFPKAYRGMTPYLGGGLGPAFVTVAGVHFSNEYEDTAGTVPADYHPVSIYNSRQDDDLSDTVLAGRLYAGADYHLHDTTVLGLKLTYSMLGTIEASSGYARHPLHARDPDFSNHNTFTGSRDWTLAVTVKFLLGN